MPALPNVRHELFAQELAKGNSAIGAYRAAGYRDESRGASTRLSAKSSVQARVAELTERAAKLAVIDKAWVLERLARNARISMGEEQVCFSKQKRGEEPIETVATDRDGSVANKALELLGKELGMFIDRVENMNTNLDITDKPQTEEEWAAEHEVRH